MIGPRAAKGTFPYLNHRTVAEIDAAASAYERRMRSAFAALNDLSRERELTDAESRRLQSLMRWAA